MSTWSSAGGATLSNSNMTAALTNQVSAYALGTLGRSSGKYYFEAVWDYTSGMYDSALVGVASASNAAYRGYYNSGHKFSTGSVDAGAYGASWADGAIIGVAVDIDGGALSFYKNGVYQGVAFADISALVTVYPQFMTLSSNTSGSMTLHTTTASFVHPAPDGYTAWDETPVATSTRRRAVL